MKIWMVTFGNDYDGIDHVELFTTEEKALKRQSESKANAKERFEHVDVDEVEVL